jgi:D-ribose pyranase
MAGAQGVAANPCPLMLIQGIINPHLLSLVSRVRHTNMLVIADAAFPFWPQLETVDISLVKGIPTIIQVLDAILPNWKFGEAYMAREFKQGNDLDTQAAFARACRGVPITFEPHLELKKRVPHAIGLIRTGDTTAYGNVVLVSA